jgi:uncharacterized protein DUF3617
MNRIQAIALLSVTAFSATIAPTATSQERMHAGLWEMTTTKGGATINTGTRCMTAEETAANNGDAKATREILDKSFAKASCVLKDMAVTGKAISYTADCGSGASAHTLSSVAEYRGNTVEFQMTVKRGTTADTMVTKGHRVGACT